ncbi:MAG: oxygen-dependent coproporphyrinogen oxidase [Chlamydiae bacterium]|nr:oxygen-dependent coproporphyrinogen oxidase [Chlamydiota bacterium]
MKEKASSYFLQLREQIISAFSELDQPFTRKPWPYKEIGGGEIGLLRGHHFEKAAVNFSKIGGKSFPMDDGQGAFFATGISLITHMRNPHAPTVHMNLRYLETETVAWFGGGYDLTPMGKYYEEDKIHFHQIAKESLDAIDPSLYPKFSEQAKNYFFIPHREKERGVGGIFFDHFPDFSVVQAVGASFLKAILPIIERRIHTPYTDEDRKEQAKFRAHYVEFNLLYDRGTKFGFQSGGNPEAILCSMPPTASW